MAEEIDAVEHANLRAVWAEYLGYSSNPELAVRFFNIVRDMFYGRATIQNFDFAYLHAIVTEAKALVTQIAGEKADISQETRVEYFR